MQPAGRSANRRQAKAALIVVKDRERLMSEEQTNWPGAAKSIVGDISLALVLILLALQLPPCCQSVTSCVEKRDAQETERELQEMSVGRAMQKDREGKVSGDDRPVPKLQSDGESGVVQTPKPEPGS